MQRVTIFSQDTQCIFQILQLLICSSLYTTLSFYKENFLSDLYYQKPTVQTREAQKTKLEKRKKIRSKNTSHFVYHSYQRLSMIMR